MGGQLVHNCGVACRIMGISGIKKKGKWGIVVFLLGDLWWYFI